MASNRRARLERLLKTIEDEKNAWLHQRGLASLLAWDKAHPEPDIDPLADYAGDGSDLTGLLRLLFEIQQ